MLRRPLDSIRPVLAKQLRRGSRTVLLTPMTARVGNLLYFWLRAHRERGHGRDLKVRESEHFGEWPAVWPSVTTLSVPRLDIGRTNRLLPVPPMHFQRFGTDFTQSELERFILDCLLSDAFGAAMRERDPTTLTINVRRGDYYSDPHLRSVYGIDVDAYLRRAVDVLGSRDLRRVVVVSDDPGWCAEHLDWLRKVGPVEVAPAGPLHHLATLASASNLVLSNSTFSYWGGYLASTLDDGCHVVAPRFHVRDIDEGRPWQHHPSWSTADPW